MAVKAYQEPSRRHPKDRANHSLGLVSDWTHDRGSRLTHEPKPIHIRLHCNGIKVPEIPVIRSERHAYTIARSERLSHLSNQGNQILRVGNTSTSLVCDRIPDGSSVKALYVLLSFTYSQSRSIPVKPKVSMNCISDVMKAARFPEEETISLHAQCVEPGSEKLQPPIAIHVFSEFEAKAVN